MGVFIAQLLSFQDKFMAHIYWPKETGERGILLAQERQNRRNIISELGAHGYWQILAADKDGGTLAVYESLLNELKFERPVMYVICKIALLCASGFLALHESCHAFGGHLSFRQRRIRALSSFDDSNALLEIKKAFEALEHVANSATFPMLFSMAASHDISFTNIAKTEGIADLDTVYCAGYSVGFGITFVFLLTDALFEFSPEDYHPPATERMTFVLGHAISKCPRLSTKQGSTVEDAVSIPYHMGLFGGTKACVDTWDKLKLTRRKSTGFDDFLFGASPCILCNEGAHVIFDHFKEMSLRAEKIKAQMDEWDISDKQHKVLHSELSTFASRYSELVQAREELRVFRDSLLQENTSGDSGQQNGPPAEHC